MLVINLLIHGLQIKGKYIELQSAKYFVVYF